MAAPVALVPAAVATCVVAAGWLYMTDPGQWIPGPRIGEALPLDELSHHAGAPVLLFVVVWAAAGAVLGIVGRRRRIDRLTAGLLLALLVGMVVYVDTAISIATVRQIPAQHAFDHAAGLPAVYLAAALAGLGGALLGHVRVSGRRAATVLRDRALPLRERSTSCVRCCRARMRSSVGWPPTRSVQWPRHSGCRSAWRCSSRLRGIARGKRHCVVDGNHAVDGLASRCTCFTVSTTAESSRPSCSSRSSRCVGIFALDRTRQRHAEPLSGSPSPWRPCRCSGSPRSGSTARLPTGPSASGLPSTRPS